MAEPEVEAAWRAEFESSGVTQIRDALGGGGVADEKVRQRFVGWVMKPKRGGSSRSKPTTISSGHS